MARHHFSALVKGRFFNGLIYLFNMESKLQILRNKFPQLFSVLEVLNKNKIPWLIGGSACLFILGNNREPDDIDIYLRNADHDAVDVLFGCQSYEYTSATEQVRNSNPFGGHALQCTSNLKITIQGLVYDLDISPTILEHRTVMMLDGLEFYLLPPEDVLLIKALLQRGSDVGKHDIADIHNFMNIYKLDMQYLSNRIVEIKAQERVGNIFAIL